MLVAGGLSWGEEVTEVTDINLFVESGCAKAAGFE